MRRELSIPILAIALAALAGPVGCGGEGSSGSGGPAGAAPSGESLSASSLSKEEYLKRASAACGKRREKILPEMAAYLGPEKVKEFTPDQFGPVFRKVVLPAFEDELEIIRDLGAPEGEEEEIEAIIAAQQAAIEAVRKLKSPESFEEVAEHFAKPSETMKEYGFTGCVNQ